jgi:hypothetical protein
MDMYEDVYWQVQSVLDETLGTEEEDGAGGGMAGDVAKLAEQRDAARAEIDRLHSWAGLMELLDEHWPAAIFPGPADAADARGDDGPRILALIRAVDAERSSRQAWAEEALRLQMLGPAKDKILGLVEAVLKGHVYRIDDYMDSEGEPMRVIPAEDIAHVMSDLERRWDAPAFRPHKVVAESDGLVCACVSDEQAALLGSGFARPVCAVHQSGGDT